MIDPADIDNVDEFLALAWLLEEEAVSRYRELGEVMDVHNDPELAELFRTMGTYGQQHADEIRLRLGGGVLPTLSIWEYDMQGEGPETVPHEAVTYRMSSTDALAIAFNQEQRACSFYTRIAKRTPNQAIRSLAATFAEEEAEHAEMVKAWRDRLSEAERHRAEDLDPPNEPE